MTGILQPVTALLLSTAILMTGHGLLMILVPIRAGLEGFSNIDIGLIGSTYFAGLVAGCILAPRVIGRVGHIRAFAVFAATSTAIPLLLAIWQDPIGWAVLRVIQGACFAGLFIGIESWLNGVSETETRGRILGAYTLVQLTVLTLGMQLVGLMPASGFELFSVVAILYSLASLPIALTATIAPVPPKRSKLRLTWLFSVSPVATLTAFLTGFATGAFWMIGPVYAQMAGLSTAGAAAFVSTAILAGAAMQWPLGSLSDRFGRRFMIGVAAIAAVVASVVLIANPATWMLYAAAVVFGAASFPIYTLALAHGNDLVSKNRAIAVSGGLLLLFSIGAAAGPLASSIAIEATTPAALFVMTGISYALIFGITLVRVQIRPKLPSRHREDFVLVPRTTPSVFALDPRADEPTATPIPPAQVPADSPLHAVPEVIAPDGVLPEPEKEAV